LLDSPGNEVAHNLREFVGAVRTVPIESLRHQRFRETSRDGRRWCSVTASSRTGSDSGDDSPASESGLRLLRGSRPASAHGTGSSFAGFKPAGHTEGESHWRIDSVGPGRIGATPE
jgi:hypothetical protein